MDAKQEFLRLKTACMEAAGEREQAEADARLDAFLNGLDEEGREAVRQAVAEDWNGLHAKAEEAEAVKGTGGSVAAVIHVGNRQKVFRPFGFMAAPTGQRERGARQTGIVHGGRTQAACRFAGRHRKAVVRHIILHSQVRRLSRAGTIPRPFFIARRSRGR